MAYRLGQFLVLLLILALTAVAVLRWGGLDTFSGAVQAVMLTPYLVLVAVLLTIILAVTGRRKLALFTGVVGVALVAAVLPRWGVQASAAPDNGTPLKVMTLDLDAGGADPGQVTDVVRKARPDLLAVQGLTKDEATRLDRAGLGRLLPYSVLRAAGDDGGTGVYATKPLLTGDPAGSAARPQARAGLSTDAGAVDIVAVAPRPPGDGDAVRDWRQDLAALPGGVQQGRQVLAGDFDGTLDNVAVRDVVDRGYTDAAAAVGSGLRGTWFGWPVPPLTVDHVLVDKGMVTRRVRTWVVGGTDHRAVQAELVLSPQ